MQATASPPFESLITFDFIFLSKLALHCLLAARVQKSLSSSLVQCLCPCNTLTGFNVNQGKFSECLLVFRRVFANHDHGLEMNSSMCGFFPVRAL